MYVLKLHATNTQAVEEFLFTQGAVYTVLDLSTKHVTITMFVLQDLVAVGYGKFSASDECVGLICCWSLKNPEVFDK